MGGHKGKLQQISVQGHSLPTYAKLMEKTMHGDQDNIAVCRSKEAKEKCGALDW